MKKRLITITLIFILMLSLSIPSYAYSLIGCKWSSSTVTWNYATGLQSTDVTAWTNSASSWTSATDADYSKVTSRTPNVYCTYQNDSGVDWDGLTYYNQSGGYFTSCTCYLNHYYTDNYVANKRRSVAGHELGHALGLNEYVGPALMHPLTYTRYDLNGYYTPQTDDINGVNYLY